MRFRFNNREEIDKAIDEFASTRHDSYNVIKNKYFDLFGSHRIPSIFFKKEAMKNSPGVFRARPSSEVKNNTNVSEFSFPPTHITVETQRASWTGRNVFYGSDLPYTALSESKTAYKGKEFYVAQWGFNLNKINQDKIRISSLAIDNTSNNNPWNPVLKGQKDFSEYLKGKISDKEADLESYLMFKISSLFIELDESKYPLSAFIADSTLYSKMNNQKELIFPILIYPSVENKSNTCNFAIHPLFVLEYMQLEKVVKLQVIDNSKESLKYSFTDIGIPISKEKIKWYNIDFEKEKSEHQITSIKCKCGQNIDISNLDKLKFKIGKRVLLHSDIIREYVLNSNYEKLFQLKDIFQEKGLIKTTQSNLTYYIPDISIMENEIEHSNLEIDLEISQPLTYIEKK